MYWKCWSEDCGGKVRGDINNLTLDWVCSLSSSDEEEYKRDVQLRQDIHQLERTLNNYDTKFDRMEAKQKHWRIKVITHRDIESVIILTKSVLGPGQYLRSPGSV